MQTTGLLPTQLPPEQASLWVQGFPSLHKAPLGLLGLPQEPFAGLHTPTSWHWLLAVQTTGLPPTQAPLWHMSVRVQALLSLQAVPSLLGGFEQSPEAALQVPALWHWSSAAHTTGLPPVQLPFEQVSVRVHPFPSSQELPLGLTGLLHVPFAGLQTPVAWH